MKTCWGVTHLRNISTVFDFFFNAKAFFHLHTLIKNISLNSDITGSHVKLKKKKKKVLALFKCKSLHKWQIYIWGQKCLLSIYVNVHVYIHTYNCLMLFGQMWSKYLFCIQVYQVGWKRSMFLWWNYFNSKRSQLLGANVEVGGWCFRWSLSSNWKYKKHSFIYKHTKFWTWKLNTQKSIYINGGIHFFFFFFYEASWT